MSKITKKEMEKISKEALNDGDQERWENKELGNSVEFARRVNPPAMDKVEPTSIRLPHSLIIDLRALAEAEGFSSYQTYLKVVLTQHVKEKKKAG
ncbi:MAG: hypothetical protein WCI18_08220 [Pseudomonadota bacterium]|jgi:hypothetical protein